MVSQLESRKEGRQVEEVRKPTFSQVASRDSKNTAVVRSKGVAASSAETLSKLQQKVDVRKEGIVVSGIKQKALGTVVVEVQGKEASARFMEVVSAEASLDVKEARKQLPLVICRGLPSTAKEANVIDSFGKQNRCLSSYKGRFRQVFQEKFRLPSRNGEQSINNLSFYFFCFYLPRCQLAATAVLWMAQKRTKTENLFIMFKLV